MSKEVLKNETGFLEYTPVGRLLFQLSLPAIVASVVNATYNFVSRIFVGYKFGISGVSALTISFPIMLIMIAIGMMFGLGTNTLISIRLGEKRKADAEKLIGQAIFLYAALTVVFIPFGLTFINPLLHLFGADSSVLPLAREYLSVIIWGTFFQGISFGVNSFIRAEGKPNIAMISMLISALINIFLDWLFIIHLETGIWGAGLATVIAQFISSSWILWYYLTGRTYLKLKWSYIRYSFPLVLLIVSFGFPSFVMQVLALVLQGIQNFQLKTYGNAFIPLETLSDGISGGSVSIGVMGICVAMGMLILMPLLGIAQGLQPIIGYNIGTKKFGRVRKALKLGLSAGILYGFLCSVLIFLFSQEILSFFVQKTDPNYPRILELGVRALRLNLCAAPAMAFVVLTTAYFQASGRPTLSMCLTLIRQAVLLIPLLFLLPYLLNQYSLNGGENININPLDGIWGASAICDLLTAGVCFVLLVLNMRRLKNFEKSFCKASISETSTQKNELSRSSVPISEDVPSFRTYPKT